MNLPVDPVFIHSLTPSSAPVPKPRQVPTMVKYRNSLILPFARDRVWNLMSDWTNLATWDLNITKSELAPGQDSNKVGLGTKYDCVFNVNGRESPVDYECIRYDPPNVSQFRGQAALFVSNDSIECEAVSDQETRLTAEFNLSFRGLLAPLSFLLNGKMQKTGPIVMKDIEQFVVKKLSGAETS